MTSRESIYVSHGTDVSEVERAIRLCLRADWVAVPEQPAREAWAVWVQREEWARVAAHVVSVYGLAASRASTQILAADQALGCGLRTLYPSMEELPSTNDPLRKSLLRAAGSGQMPAHVATFCAVSAQLTFLPLLVALQATFFLEWRARQATLSEATVAAFLHASAPFIQQLRTFLSAHESSDKPRFGVL